MLASNSIIMPVLGMNQDSGNCALAGCRRPAELNKGEPLLEVETDKAVAEIEAPATGVLGKVSAWEGDDVPVGTLIAGHSPQWPAPRTACGSRATLSATQTCCSAGAGPKSQPYRRRIAAEHNLDLALVHSDGGVPRKPMC